MTERFEILRILGRGGAGTVYLAHDKRLGRQVALKVLNAEDLAAPDAGARFLQEARAAAPIRHPNVATVYEVGETEEGQPFLVLEYCQGETLAQRIRREPIEAGEFLRIAKQMAAGIAAAHATGIVHRDLKAANIILERAGTVKILDFGLAKLRQTLGKDLDVTDSSSGRLFGTLPYLSPEQAAGRPADQRSDLFSCGVILYQMASGLLPFDGSSPLVVLEKIRDGEPKPLAPRDPSFPPSLGKMIGRLLQKDPRDRYQSATELLAELEEVEAPTERLPPPGSSASLLGRTVRPASWKRVAVIVLLLFAVGAAIYLSQHRTAVSLADAAPPPRQPIRSMAVLPMTNLARSERDEFLSVGLADALITKLGQIPELQIRPTSSIVQYRDKKMEPRRAGQALQVDAVMEGHFLAAGNLVRVNLQLTDARTGYSVWTGSVDGKRDDLLRLIDDVATRTTDALREQIGVRQVTARYSLPKSSSPRAFEEYLRARAVAGSLVPREFEEHVTSLQRAVDLDPRFAAAYADLAIALSLGEARRLTTEADSMEKAERYARHAVRLDPNLPEAHLALGRVFVRDTTRYRESVREILAALRLNPDLPHALNTMATYFVSTGDAQNIRCLAQRMERVEPGAADLKTRGYWNINSVDPEGALQNAEYALAARDTELAGHDIRGMALILIGNHREADAAARRALDLVPSHYLGKSLKAMNAAAQGDRAAAENWITMFTADGRRNHWAAIRIALCYARLGDRDRAIEWLQTAAALGHHSWYALVKHPWLQSLQSDPDFQAIVAAIKADLDDVRDDVIGVYQLICGEG